MNLDQNLMAILGGAFFSGILIGYALKKIIKMVAIIAGFFLAALSYLRYQQIAKYELEWVIPVQISSASRNKMLNGTV